MEEAVSKDSRFKEFFLTIQAIMRNNKISQSQRWEKKEMELHNSLMAAQKSIHAAMLDNFDIPKVIKILDDLISDVYQYQKESGPKLPLLIKVSNFIKYILGTFGLDYTDQQ